jgi:hypothetical protein
MKKSALTAILAAVFLVAGSTAFADNDGWHNSDSYYKDLYELRCRDRIGGYHLHRQGDTQHSQL